MKVALAVVAGLIAGVAATLVVVLALDDDEPANETPVSAESPSPARCAEIIPDKATAALGWDDAAEAVEHIGRCERRESQSGRITVGTRALGVSGDDRPKALADEYDAKCGALGGAARAEQSPAWLTTHNDACAELPKRGIGVVEMFVLLDDDLVQIRIESMKPIKRTGLHDSLNALAEAAAAVY
jgi:hypothetical protein